MEVIQISKTIKESTVKKGVWVIEEEETSKS